MHEARAEMTALVLIEISSLCTEYLLAEHSLFSPEASVTAGSNWGPRGSITKRRYHPPCTGEPAYQVLWNIYCVCQGTDVPAGAGNAALKCCPMFFE